CSNRGTQRLCNPPRASKVRAMIKEQIPGGLLIAIEGIDGAGKTTLAHALARILESAGATVVLGKEPTNGPWGTRLRQSAATGRLSPEQEGDYLLRERRQHGEGGSWQEHALGV